MTMQQHSTQEREPSRFGVRVLAPARLHLGFIDMSGTRARRFGSVGLTLDALYTQVTAHVAQQAQLMGEVIGEDKAVNERVKAYLQVLHQQGLSMPLQLCVRQEAPTHAGFGSGTQLALAVARAVMELHQDETPLSARVGVLERGSRSGAGLAAFRQGGFVIDGGHAVASDGSTGTDTPPPLLVRMDFPAAWRILLIMDSAHVGMHGAAERAAFAALPPFPRASAERLSHAMLMQALPALAELNIAAFGAAVTELQEVVGDHFASAQGGRYASPAVAAVLRELAQAGVAGYGQSSWGPTGFAFFSSQQQAQQWQAQLAQDYPLLRFMIVSGRNHGADVMRLPAQVLRASEADIATAVLQEGPAHVA